MSSIGKEISTFSGYKPSRHEIELLRSVIGEINNSTQAPEGPTAKDKVCEKGDLS